MLKLIAKNTLLLQSSLATFSTNQKYPILGAESIMKAKGHGTCQQPVQHDLRFGCDYSIADRICCFNRHYAEHSGYAFSPKLTWIKEIKENAEKNGANASTTYYDSVTGKSLFIAPIGRTLWDFITESDDHGWPSFRDSEVDWTNVRCLKNGEVVSVDGTHLGHNLPDEKGNRYCINLVSIAG